MKRSPRRLLNALLIQAAKPQVFCHRSEPDWHYQEKPIHLCNQAAEHTPVSIPRFCQQRASFFHACAPDLHHLFIIALIKTAVVAVL